MQYTWVEFAVFLIYEMSISDYKQTIFVLKAPTGIVFNVIQAAYIGLGIVGYFCI